MSTNTENLGRPKSRRWIDGGDAAGWELPFRQDRLTPLWIAPMRAGGDQSAVLPVCRFRTCYLSEPEVLPFIESGELLQVLADWSPYDPGYHLYYLSQRRPTPAFSQTQQLA